MSTFFIYSNYFLEKFHYLCAIEEIHYKHGKILSISS